MDEPGGIVTWTGVRKGDPEGEITSREVIAEITGVILRGPVAHTPVAFDTLLANPGALIRWIEGSIALTDFCDNYGRLLEVLGEPGIRSALPNPTDGNLSVRYFIPVSARHIITLVDMSGAVVLRIDLDDLPPGERIQELDLQGVATGHYLLVIEAGRFRFTEEIVRR